MKTVTYTDQYGFMHRSMIRDCDTDPAIGIIKDPPDLNLIDWDLVKKDLHNELVARGIFESLDLSKDQNGLSGAILAALKTKLIKLFTLEATDGK